MIEDTVRLRELTNDLPVFESLRKQGEADAHTEICKHLLLQSFRESEVILNIGTSTPPSLLLSHESLTKRISKLPPR